MWKTRSYYFTATPDARANPTDFMTLDCFTCATSAHTGATEIGLGAFLQKKRTKEGKKSASSFYALKSLWEETSIVDWVKPFKLGLL